MLQRDRTTNACTALEQAASRGDICNWTIFDLIRV